MNRGLLRGLGPAQFVPSWAGGGDPSNDGKGLVLDSTQEGGVSAGWPVPLLARTAYNGSATISTTSSTFADIDATNLAVTFTTSPSGAVIVTLSGLCTTTSNAITYGWALREGSSDVANSQQSVLFNFPGYVRVAARIKVSGLTPGSIHTYKWSHGLQFGSGTASIQFGSTNAGLMEVSAA